MVIEKVLNNNVVTSKSENGKEIVVMGRGIAFQHRAGDPIDPAVIEKVFTISEPGISEKFLQIVEKIPINLVLMAERIINYAKITLGKKISDSIYVTLPDHIYGSIQRYRENIVLNNPLKWDISRFYPDEYKIGLKAVEVIREETGVEFANDEAAFIALHFVNAQLDEDIRRMYDITYIMQEVCTIVHNHFNMEFDEDSLNYYRFITHLKFFAQRVTSNTHYDDDESDMLMVIRHKYPAAYACTEKVSHLMESKYHFAMTSDEKLYLTVHIARIQPRGER